MVSFPFIKFYIFPVLHKYLPDYYKLLPNPDDQLQMLSYRFPNSISYIVQPSRIFFCAYRLIPDYYNFLLNPDDLLSVLSFRFPSTNSYIVQPPLIFLVKIGPPRLL
jgi:hypothetical protein